jgi:hypothetical protein
LLCHRIVLVLKPRSVAHFWIPHHTLSLVSLIEFPSGT